MWKPSVTFTRVTVVGRGLVVMKRMWKWWDKRSFRVNKSIRRLSAETNIHKSTVQRILRQDIHAFPDENPVVPARWGTAPYSQGNKAFSQTTLSRPLYLSLRRRWVVTVFPWPYSSWFLLAGISEGQDLWKPSASDSWSADGKHPPKNSEHSSGNVFQSDGEHDNAFAGSNRTTWSLRRTCCLKENDTFY